MWQQIDKPAYNEEYRVCDFSTVLETDDYLIAGTVTAYDSNDVNVSADMIDEVSISTDLFGIRYKLLGGTEGEKYSIIVRVETFSNQKFEEPFTLCVS